MFLLNILFTSYISHLAFHILKSMLLYVKSFFCYEESPLPLRFFGKPRDDHRTNEIAIDI
jgi:hypothetical protein